MQRAACDRQHLAAPPRRPGNCPTDRDRRQYALDTRKCRTLPGLEEFRPLFSEQERAAEDEDWERADACNIRIRNALALTFPDGGSVAEFMLRIHNNGTAGWRWHDEPFDAVNP
ncbi:MAG TPA: hypothetical protein VIR33_11780 [Thermopolyspora sp.]